MSPPRKKKQKNTTEGRPAPTDRSVPKDDRPQTPDAVEEASRESFPASDSPSWSPLHPGKPAKHPDR